MATRRSKEPPGDGTSGGKRPPKGRPGPDEPRHEEPVNLSELAQARYLNYALSVITGAGVARRA